LRAIPNNQFPNKPNDIKQEKRMSPEELTKLVKEKARFEGADLVGIASVSRYAGAPEPVRPQSHLPEAKAVIVMAVHHLDATVDFGAEPNSNYPGGFQIGMIPKLDTMAVRVGRYLEDLGYPTIPIMCTTYWHHRHQDGVPFDHHASFSHINALVAAGLGEYGWHGMSMSYKYGPRQRIVSVITSAPLVADPMYTGEPLCDRCKLCEKACWGENYKPEKLLGAKTISFEIEGKKLEYAHINRWRCFWGEQCHLDMTHLAERDEMDEKGIYDAMDSGVVRVLRGNAGYMCSSFKYCMAKPLRTWDRSRTKSPRRIKPAPTAQWDEIKTKLKEYAIKAGADSVAVFPMEKFQENKTLFEKEFRTDDFYKAFKWVVAFGARKPKYLGQPGAMVAKNVNMATHITGRLQPGIYDFGRYLDDGGYEAFTPWYLVQFEKKAAALAGWENKVVASLTTDAPMEECVFEVDRPLDSLKSAAEVIGLKQGLLPQVDVCGVASLASLGGKAAAELRELVPEAKSLIVLGQGMSKRVVELAGRNTTDCLVSYIQANMQALRETTWGALDMASALRKLGYAAEGAIEVDSLSKGRPMNHIGKMADLQAQAPFAAAAGLGFVAKNGFLTSKDYGQRLRFSFVLTSAELPESRRIEGSCPEGCRLCVDACPSGALSCTDCGQYARNDDRCEWVRVLGMTEGAGSTTTGWRVPSLPVPDKLDDEARKAALAQKDPIQVRCYQNPNQADTQIERCMQVCPFNK
jgi:epoxyqueuosine reductase QueG